MKLNERCACNGATHNLDSMTDNVFSYWRHWNRAIFFVPVLLAATLLVSCSHKTPAPISATRTSRIGDEFTVVTFKFDSSGVLKGRDTMHYVVAATQLTAEGKSAASLLHVMYHGKVIDSVYFVHEQSGDLSTRAGYSDYPPNVWMTIPFGSQTEIEFAVDTVMNGMPDKGAWKFSGGGSGVDTVAGQPFITQRVHSTFTEGERTQTQIMSYAPALGIFTSVREERRPHHGSEDEELVSFKLGP